MPYIARTDGGQTVIEIREGILADIPEADRGNWRSVVEGISDLDGASKVRGGLALTVSEDGSQVSLVWQAVDAPEAWARFRLRQTAADVRWRKQTGGITLPDGTKIRTDDESQAKIHQALSVLDKGWTEAINFKTGGGFVSLDLAAMTAVSQAVAAHVQACFSAEAGIVAAIEAGDVTTVAAVETWPDWP